MFLFPCRGFWKSQLATATFLAASAAAQPAMEAPVPEAVPVPDAVAPVVVPLNEERIFKVIPDYQTVQDSRRNIAPMTVREKWNLAWREVIDPFNIGTAAVTAAESQWGNETPRYGQGAAAYSKRFGAAIADSGTQTFLATGLYATLLRQDPRYFRRGPPSKVVPRVFYAMGRVVITREDSGKDGFNTSNILGLVSGIAISNAYYPRADRTTNVMVGRLGTSLMGDVVGNLMSEFWPDISRKFFHKKPRT